MKKTSLLFIAASLSLGGFAQMQNMTMDSSMCNQTASCGASVSMPSPVTCTGSSSSTFVCQMDSNMCPSGWTVHFCGGMSSMSCDSNMMPPSMNMMNFSMMPMQTYNLGMKFYTNSVPATGVVRVKIYEQGNPGNYVTVNYKLTTFTTGMEESDAVSFSLYPAIAHDFIHIENYSQSSTAVLYNAFGNKMLEQPANGSKLSLSVNDLPAGIYFVKIKNEQGESSRKFIKVN